MSYIYFFYLLYILLRTDDKVRPNRSHRSLNIYLKIMNIYSNCSHPRVLTLFVMPQFLCNKFRNKLYNRPRFDFSHCNVVVVCSILTTERGKLVRFFLCIVHHNGISFFVNVPYHDIVLFGWHSCHLPLTM